MKRNHAGRLCALLLALTLLLSLSAPVYAENNGGHRIEQRSYPMYLSADPEDTLNQPFPLYFIDGVEDLPYVEIEDWAAFLCFINQEAGDEGYNLEMSFTDSTLTLERENGYSLCFDYVDDRLTFDDYDAFMHNSNDTALIDLVTENSTDQNGVAQLILRDKKASFDRYGEEMVVDLDAYGIHMVVQDNGLYVPPADPE